MSLSQSYFIFLLVFFVSCFDQSAKESGTTAYSEQLTESSSGEQKYPYSLVLRFGHTKETLFGFGPVDSSKVFRKNYLKAIDIKPLIAKASTSIAVATKSVDWTDLSPRVVALQVGKDEDGQLIGNAGLDFLSCKIKGANWDWNITRIAAQIGRKDLVFMRLLNVRADAKEYQFSIDCTNRGKALKFKLSTPIDTRFQLFPGKDDSLEKYNSEFRSAYVATATQTETRKSTFLRSTAFYEESEDAILVLRLDYGMSPSDIENRCSIENGEIIENMDSEKQDRVYIKLDKEALVGHKSSIYRISINCLEEVVQFRFNSNIRTYFQLFHLSEDDKAIYSSRMMSSSSYAPVDSIVKGGSPHRFSGPLLRDEPVIVIRLGDGTNGREKGISVTQVHEECEVFNGTLLNRGLDTDRLYIQLDSSQLSDDFWYQLRIDCLDN